MALTKHLLSIPTKTSYDLAIDHPFLRDAGSGTLSHDLLALWLSQDRIYASRAYPRYIGLLIANLTQNTPKLIDSSEQESFKRIFRILTFSLDNVGREMDFFNETAEKWGLELDVWQERQGTKTYLAEMDIVAKDRRVEHGLVFLWAMEKVYLDAWSSVKAQLDAQNLQSADANPTLSAVISLATNWSNPDFVAFVDNLGSLVDSLDIQPETDTWRECEEIWEKVVEIEATFWPENGEERRARK
ncbi:hypothetical protein VNI00_017810 [Paramarasmius palmivorus]|uniref:Thiaminase-2/PQQC domain-containing protein n=1 Tax=Paramarasmius palmivorus TaxID=297713 RepID=A0AAW0B2R8_9AGAR